jgi:ATP-dependent DNA helicase DinG
MSPPADMYGCFGPGGWLQKSHPGYEYRAGQLQMAKAVEAALRQRKHLLVEAGTGTGKTLAYLIPALLTEHRVIISTGTKNLQDQLYYKDVPFLAEHLAPMLGRPLKVCYMKGRGNYLCRQKVYDMDGRPVLRGLEEVEEFARIRQWEESTETGDRSELEELAEDSPLWHRLDARRETCTGSKCKQYDRCFLTLMHNRALDSDIIIVNHHLFFADLALRQNEYGGILPNYGAVVFDEAHEIESVAGEYFGLECSNYRFDELVRDAEQTLRQKESLNAGLMRAISFSSRSSPPPRAAPASTSESAGWSATLTSIPRFKTRSCA